MPDSKDPDPKGLKRAKDPDGKGQPPQGSNNPNLFSRGMFSWLLIGALIVALFLMFSTQQNRPKEVTWLEFKSYIEQDAFKDAVVVESAQIVGELKEGSAGSIAEEAPNNRVSVAIDSQTEKLFVYEMNEMGQKNRINTSTGLLLHFIMNWGPFFLIAFLIYFFVFRSLRNAGGGPGMLGSFGRSKHKVVSKEHSTVTLMDVAGIEEAKDEIGEIIEFLKNPKKFQRLGGRVPRGVLLIGSPGCGKTLLAKAVAGEADVPFFSISGSDFVEMFVGVGASRVRDLFKQAKDSSPCIIFLDEIDAVGRRRGSGYSSGGHDEREQTLNAILVEMDGFESNDQVIVMAATNRADVLDPALTRPGRFDRQLTVPLPDVKGRVEILKVHSRKVKMSPDVDIEKLARGTPMFSGADLAAIINEAAIGATLLNKDFVEQDDLEEARDKVKWGRARKSHAVEEEERVATAWHEAGHAVAQTVLPHTDPLHKVTIIPRGQSMGATIGLPEKDRHNYTRKYILDTMRVLCAGRIAEERKTDDVSSGASMDIRMATGMARHMILEWGMSERLGFIDFSSHDDGNSLIPEKSYSPETARIIDEEIKILTDDAYEDTRKLIEENWEKVCDIGEALLKYETLNKDEVNRIMSGEKLTKATVSDLLQAEKAKAAADAKPTQQPDTDLNEDPPGVMPSPA